MIWTKGQTKIYKTVRSGDRVHFITSFDAAHVIILDQHGLNFLLMINRIKRIINPTLL